MAKKNRNDQIFTPDKYVEDMLDRIGYVKNLVGKTVLENSCGQGNILVPIVNRYIKDAKIQGLSDKCIAESLSQNIIGFEIDKEQREKCIEYLDRTCSFAGIENVQWSQTQAQSEQIRKMIYQLLGESPSLQSPEIAGENKAYLDNGTLIDEESEEFRCGVSKAGEEIYTVLEKLKEKNIKYKLLFTDDDLDVRVEYCGKTYYCEIRVTDYAGMKKRGPVVEREKKKEWQKTGNVCGVLYYYKVQDIMNLYIYSEEERTEIVKLG